MGLYYKVGRAFLDVVLRELFRIEVWGVEHVPQVGGVLIAIALHLSLGRDKASQPHHRHAVVDRARAETRSRWLFVSILAATNALRFTANAGLFVMFNTWAKAQVLLDHSLQIAATQSDRPQQFLAQAAANNAAYLATAMNIGMGLSVLLGGRLIRRGGERWPLVWLSVLGGIAIISFGPVANASVESMGFGLMALAPVCLLVAIMPVGFFGTFPATVSLGQRLLPEHASLVTSLMMGIGWVISAAHAPLAQLFFGNTPLDRASSLPLENINWGFYGFGGILIAGGLLTLIIPASIYSRAAHEH
ncbi:MAG: MFS transporter [Deltaproteobacteria bacterium]|nr:MFS transporter [Deltaproteobacteria bacterium]